MKQITLKEAFEKATKGPLEINISEPCSIRRDSGFKVADTWLESDSTLEESKTNAALLAHCFNTYQELVEAAEAYLESRKTCKNKVSAEHNLKTALAKAQTITLP